jgi:hypothetical protein
VESTFALRTIATQQSTGAVQGFENARTNQNVKSKKFLFKRKQYSMQFKMTCINYMQ